MLTPDSWDRAWAQIWRLRYHGWAITSYGGTCTTPGVQTLYLRFERPPSDHSFAEVIGGRHA